MKRPYAVWCQTDRTYHWWRAANYSTRERAEKAAEEIRQRQFLTSGTGKWIRAVEVRV